MERAHRTIRYRIYKYFTCKIRRHIDFTQKFLRANKYTIHSATRISPSRVTDKDIVPIWWGMGAKRRRVVISNAKFCIGQHVDIGKWKSSLPKTAEQNFSTEIFMNAKVIDRLPRPVYDLEDLNRLPIDGQFYREQLSLIRVTRSTAWKIDKLLDNRVRRWILLQLVRWRVYSREFSSCIPDSSEKDLRYETLS